MPEYVGNFKKRLTVLKNGDISAITKVMIPTSTKTISPYVHIATDFGLYIEDVQLLCILRSYEESALFRLASFDASQTFLIRLTSRLLSETFSLAMRGLFRAKMYEQRCQ